ncbi:MAG TPA: hypothetical protein DEF35_22690 [Paenibacillus sp.]|jgi:hypothetical protein|uniref:hypothetical protein n=1 Tax=Paenibacillus TaxID=44249 RepID=UPI000BA008EA|nr:MULTISPECIES: hypothetical protein [Paenibacillus]OZQ65714.1 hypothetical protein CA599_19875 [Paenibacillus taichungensis]HBU84425.1 hypothetical protein [Paenibacillus sp.]
MEQFSNDDCYAYRRYPEPDGTSYSLKDLMTEKKVEQLFDFCQILEAVIYDVGWDFLIQYYGYALLYEINNKSGWFDCSDMEEYKEYIEAYRNDMKRSEKRN